jgi:hypothetical protein
MRQETLHICTKAKAFCSNCYLLVHLEVGNQIDTAANAHSFANPVKMEDKTLLCEVAWGLEDF